CSTNHGLLRNHGLTCSDASLRTSTLNRGFLADRGWSSSINFELASPGSDYTFYKVNLEGEYYFPLTNRWTLRAKGDVGYGDGYGDNKDLPFFENFYAGGIGSVRSYRSRSLGPRSPAVRYEHADDCGAGNCTQDPDPDRMGGNLLVEASLELIWVGRAS